MHSFSVSCLLLSLCFSTLNNIWSHHTQIQLPYKNLKISGILLLFLKNGFISILIHGFYEIFEKSKKNEEIWKQSGKKTLKNALSGIISTPCVYSKIYLLPDFLKCKRKIPRLTPFSQNLSRLGKIFEKTCISVLSCIFRLRQPWQVSL